MLIDLGNRLARVRRALRSRVLRRLGGFASCGRASIDPGVRIDNPGGMRIGDGVLLLRGTWLYCIPGAPGEPAPELVLGERTYVGFGCHLTCARRVHLGPGCLLGNGVYIADNQHRFEDVGRAPLEQGLRVGEVEVGEGTWIGEHAAIFGTVHLGRHCVVGAGAVVTDRDFPDYCVIVGAPARIVKRFDPAAREWRRTDPDGGFA